jgi:hypothetical protein
MSRGLFDTSRAGITPKATVDDRETSAVPELAGQPGERGKGSTPSRREGLGHTQPLHDGGQGRRVTRRRVQRSGLAGEQCRQQVQRQPAGAARSRDGERQLVAQGPWAAGGPDHGLQLGEVSAQGRQRRHRQGPTGLADLCRDNLEAVHRGTDGSQQSQCLGTLQTWRDRPHVSVAEQRHGGGALGQQGADQDDVGL